MSRERAKGTRWESTIIAFLKRVGVTHAERRALGGSRDRGDITGIPGVVIEAKDCRELRPGPWVDEANVEARNDGADLGVTWAKRRGKADAEDGLVVMDGQTFVRLLRAAGYVPEATP